MRLQGAWPRSWGLVCSKARAGSLVHRCQTQGPGSLRATSPPEAPASLSPGARLHPPSRGVQGVLRPFSFPGAGCWQTGPIGAPTPALPVPLSREEGGALRNGLRDLPRQGDPLPARPPALPKRWDPGPCPVTQSLEAAAAVTGAPCWLRVDMVTGLLLVRGRGQPAAISFIEAKG